MLAMWFQRVLVSHPQSQKVHESPPLSPIVEDIDLNVEYDVDMDEIDLSSLKHIGQTLRDMGDDFNAGWAPSSSRDQHLTQLFHVLIAVGFSCWIYSCFR